MDDKEKIKLLEEINAVLLKALQDILNDYEDGHFDIVGISETLISQAENAIKKTEELK